MKIAMQSQKESKTIQKAFEEFVFIKKSQNLSNSTIEDYVNAFNKFAEFCGGDYLCKDITEQTVQEYMMHLKTMPKKQNNPDKQDVGEPLSSVSVASYVRKLRVLLNYFMSCNYTNFFKIKLPQYAKQVKAPYTTEQATKLLQKPNIKNCSFSEYRNWVMTNFFIATACRISTLADMKISHLSFENETIYLGKVKNGRAFIIPMQKDLKKILIEYLKYRKGEPDDYLFCPENNDKKGLAVSSIKTVMNRYNRTHEVNITSMHRWRNYFAQYWLSNNGSKEKLKELLGHSDEKMVNEYAQLYANDLQIGYETYNPLSSLTKGEHVAMTKNSK